MTPARAGCFGRCRRSSFQTLYLFLILVTSLVVPATAQIMAPNCPIGGDACSGGPTCCGEWSAACEVPGGLETIHAALVHSSSATKVLVWGWTAVDGVYADAKLWNPIADCGSFDPGFITWPIGFRAMIAGSVATFMSGAVAGMLL